MALWVDDKAHALHWISPAVVFVGVFLLYLGSTKASRPVYMSLFKNCYPLRIKESCRNMWQLLSVVLAVLLAILVNMLQADAITPYGYEMDSVIKMHFQQCYISCCIGALVFDLMALTMCLVNLGFVDPLTDTDALRFFLAMPDNAADPLIWTGCCLLFFLFALVFYLFAAYGLPMGLSMIAALVTYVIAFSVGWTGRCEFKLDADMKWTQDKRMWKKGRTHKSVYESKEDEEVQAFIGHMGAILMEAEARKKVEKAPDMQKARYSRKDEIIPS
mmetsp:Transcript_32636/g.61358  ORF Transcript_32636/g.61358 Transcript_32636/m.61358 type:complete len:274 (+) Transcript_32636:44-865(+)